MTCEHIWPGELTEDACCLLGCGTPYAEWSEVEGSDSSLESTSLTYTYENEVLR